MEIYRELAASEKVVLKEGLSHESHGSGLCLGVAPNFKLAKGCV